VIVQMTATPGTIALVANSPDLGSAYLNLESVAPQCPRLSVPRAARKHFLADWRMGPITPHRPDVHAEVLAQDVNSWERIEPGKPQAAWQAFLDSSAGSGGGYAVYRTTFTPPKSMQASGGRIVFQGIGGDAEIFVGDATTVTTAPGPVEVVLPASNVAVTVSVLVRVQTLPAGLIARVELHS
jgi:hypothetical protein